MDLKHRFAVPTPPEQTWAYFQDIAGLATCFPGARLAEIEGDTFRGSCTVKLGPIALVYNGSGRFVEKDDAAHRFVVEAKGKDKRGNGTAGATVTLSMSPGSGAMDGGTEVEVLSDLAITGKPAQFGRGVMQDVSDKLLGQFVACLESRLAAVPPSAPAPRAAAVPPPTAPPEALTRAPRHHSEDDALNLGATVVPVLLRTYAKPALGAGLVLLLAWWLLRRHR